MKSKVLPASFYHRNTALVARKLLGKILVRKMGKKVLAGKIVETEAYFEDDPASHAYRGITARNRPMFEEPGHAYVYFIYGNHYCLNVVTERHGKAGAVLIRALEPVVGIREMQKNRSVHDIIPYLSRTGYLYRYRCGIIHLTNGPGKLTQALGIDRQHNRTKFTSGNLVIVEGEKEKIRIVKTTRIGIKEAQEHLYRFYIKRNKFVSRK